MAEIRAVFLCVVKKRCGMQPQSSGGTVRANEWFL